MAYHRLIPKFGIPKTHDLCFNPVQPSYSFHKMEPVWLSHWFSSVVAMLEGCGRALLPTPGDHGALGHRASCWQTCKGRKRNTMGVVRSQGIRSEEPTRMEHELRQATRMGRILPIIRLNCFRRALGFPNFGLTQVAILAGHTMQHGFTGHWKKIQHSKTY